MHLPLGGFLIYGITVVLSVIQGIPQVQAQSLEPPLFSARRIEHLQNRTQALFFHGWNNYIDHAFPADELRPISCEGVSADPNRLHFGRNDAMGNFSLTLIDALDMLPILGEQRLFEQWVEWIRHNLSFNKSSIVQVFEVNIRVVGGLLSAHLYASVPELGHAIPGYNGHLLALAHDLASRLLPAFNSPTGIPYPRVHLQRGIVPINGHYYTETSAAAAGTLLLEFGMLSRLTGDTRFERLARKSFFQVWKRRSHLDLLGMALDVNSGIWTEPFCSIGASVDSFYEYALKYALLFDDHDVYRVWEQAYAAVVEHMSDGAWVHPVVHMHTGRRITNWIDALSAFWAGLQVLQGRLGKAVRSHLTYYKLWNTFGGIPERFNIAGPLVGHVDLEWYLLRPEFVESNYYLYRATRDPFYLQVGEAILNDLEQINKVTCGVSGTQDLRTGLLSDRMDSFFLSETVKYLYLLFTPEHALNADSNVVFSTEAHPLWMHPNVLSAANVSRFPTFAQRLQEPPALQPQQQQRRLKLGSHHWFRKRHSPRNQTPIPKRVTAASAYLNDTCQAVIDSSVASWRQFYLLDRLLPFEKPEWLYRKTDIEFHNGFYDVHVDNDAVCIA